MTRILIVDDLEKNLYLLDAVLKGHGFEVISARNGKDALERARSASPDLIITDILMPVMDGFELCRQWKADPGLKHIPLIFYTATYTDEKDERLALSLGADRFLVKPLRPAILIREIQEVLARPARGCDGGAAEPRQDEMELLRQYNDALFRKLEKKVADLTAEIAERERTQAALAEEERFLDTIVENIPDLIYVKGADDLRIIRYNRACKDLLGYPWEQDPSGDYWNLLPADQAAFFREKDREAIRTGEIVDIPREKISTMAKGDRILHTKKIPIKGPDGAPVYLLGISEDITERVHAEEALARATRKLAFLNAIAFEDIQNALFSLQGYLELGKMGRAPAEIRDYLEKQTAIVDSLSHAIIFARNYQDLGQRPPAWQNVGISFLVAVSHLAPLNLSRDLQVEGLELYGDPLLEKVFLALVENTVEHAGTATKIRLYWKERPDGLNLVYEDDGKGIPDDRKAKIFDRRCGDKKGIGLFLAREILSITSITLDETGENGKGARFEMNAPPGSFRFVKKTP